MASLNMLKEMKESGVMEFGSHTMNHPKLNSLPDDMIEWELKESKKQIEKALDVKIRSFAYPYGIGAYDEKIRQKVFDAGYMLDFSFKQGKTLWPLKTTKPLDRLFIKGDENNFDLYLHLTRGASRLI